MEKKELLHATLKGKIVEVCFEISNEQGCGFLESVYQSALGIALEQKGLAPKREMPLDVRFRGQVVGRFFTDIVVEDKVILELKAVKALAPEHFAQALNYLNGTGIKVGLLVNFGQPKLEYRRLERKPALTPHPLYPLHQCSITNKGRSEPCDLKNLNRASGNHNTSTRVFYRHW